MAIGRGTTLAALLVAACAGGGPAGDPGDADARIDRGTEASGDLPGDSADDRREEAGPGETADPPPDASPDASPRDVQPDASLPSNGCGDCHRNSARLLADLEADPPPPRPLDESKGECCGGEVPPAPVHQKVRVTADFDRDPVHGALACTDCHGGDPTATTRREAHAGLVADPSVPDPGDSCGRCHPEVATTFAQSLHATEAGKRRSVEIRAGGPLSPLVDSAYRTHCGRCHASCGQCHVSAPAPAGGGLLQGHAFVRRAPGFLTCTGCHGTRVRQEYEGRNAGIPADVHFLAGMECTDCHSGDGMHGKGGEDATHRYDVDSSPRCSDCHPDGEAFRRNPFHAVHRDELGALLLSCQACHAAEWKGCVGCHVSLSPAGVPVSEVNEPDHVSWLGVRLGFNPRRDARHPERWVPLRRVPAAPGLFDFYGPGLLPAFDAAPTWTLATPHTIRRTTARTANCTDSCHGNRAVFLGPGDLRDYEEAANEAVVVVVPPGP